MLSRVSSSAILLIYAATIFQKAHGLGYAGQDDPYFSATGFPRPWAPQYTSWYPKYGPYLLSRSSGTCNATLEDYNTAYHAPKGSLASSQLLSICYQHEACVYDGLTSDEQLNFQSAAVVLGLLPTLMSSIGLSISEIALLSAHRPVLSLILSLAAPAIWPTRIFEYNDPRRTLDATGRLLELAPLTPWKAWMLSLLQYTLGLGAVVNNLLTCWELGNKTILSWGCTTVFLPLMWTSLAAVPHIPAALSYGIVTWQDRKDDGRAFLRQLWSLAGNELTICANHRHSRQRNSNNKVSRAAVMLNIVAGGLSFVYLFFGTVVFSSLVFISVWEVLNKVLWRFILSSAVARIILMVELAGLQANN